MADPFISSANVETRGAHDHVHVFVRGQNIGELVCGLGDGERVRNILLSEKYFGTGRAPEGPIGTHDRIAWRVLATNWLDVDEVIGEKGFIGRMVLRLLDRIQELEDEQERPTEPPPEYHGPPIVTPSLLDLVRTKGQKFFIEDVPWFVKDFHVLYKTAKQLIDREPDARGNTPDSDFEDLERQLERLKPAFDHCEAVRKTASASARPRW